MHRNEDVSTSKKSRKRKHEQTLSVENIDLQEEKAEEGVERKGPVRKRRRKNNDKDVADAASQQAAIDALQPHQPIVAREFSSRDVDFLSQNENARYLNSSKKVGHAVIVKDKEGSEVALQYRIPAGTERETPEFRPLNNIEEIERFGMTRYRANTPNGTQMFATRFEEGEFDGEQLRIWNFSPSLKGKEPFFGSEKELTLFKPEALEDEDVKAELAEIYKKGQQTKGGRELLIDPPSVKARDGIKTRNPDQNTVMGESAKDAYEAFLENWEDELTPEIKEVFKRSVEAPLRDVFKGQHRPEWLHAEGHSLTPMGMDPQRKDNLGAAPKWANTEMMILERVVKWFALNRPEAKETIRPYFEMLFDSELIKKIYFNVTIEEQNHIFKLSQEINPLKKWPLFRKPTDLAQETAIVFSMLHGIDPVSKGKVKKSNEKLQAHKSASDAAAHQTAGKLAEVNTAPKIVAPIPVRPQPMLHQAAQSAQPAVNHFPTKIRYEDSVMQIYTTAQEFDYSEPWHGARQQSWHGSGLVIEHEGKKYILTNAHVAENAVNMRVRFANDRQKKFQAKRKCISYQSDLALLEIDDPVFQRKAVPVELGSMVSMQQPVETVGFPMGGNEVNISKGIVSRIEVGTYCKSELDMLHVGVDAAINPGNSGGPVFSDGKVVGVAFQGYDRQGLSFMIPMPIVHHFIKEAFNGKPYRGYPILPIEFEILENPALRMSYGMKPEQTGVRVQKVDIICDAHDKLQPDDILLEIDGLPISNEGTVDIPGIGNVIDMLTVTHLKFIGDSVKLKLLRKEPDSDKPKEIIVSVVLDSVPLETTKVPQKEFDKVPTYFISSGVSFVPLTRNYMEERGADLEEYVNSETGDRITETPKHHPDEQYVVVNDVLDSEATEGYEDYINAIVKEVNGKTIRNIRDVVAAMDNHEGKYHMVITASGRRLVVPNMSPAENAALLKRYHIHADRSEDLRDASLADAMDIDERKDVAAKVPVKQSTAKMVALFNKQKSAEESSSELVSDLEISEDEPADKHKGELTADQLPGVRRYRNVVDRMEHFYSQFDDEAMDAHQAEFLASEDDADFEDISLSEKSVSESLSEESSDEKDTRHRQAKKPANSHSFFGKRKRDEDDEEERARDRKHFKK